LQYSKTPGPRGCLYFKKKEGYMRTSMQPAPKAYYHRNLPHWHPPGVPIFFTFRLYGSLPAKVMQELKSMQRLLAREISTLSGVDQQKRRV